MAVCQEQHDETPKYNVKSMAGHEKDLVELGRKIIYGNSV